MDLKEATEFIDTLEYIPSPTERSLRAEMNRLLEEAKAAKSVGDFNAKNTLEREIFLIFDKVRAIRGNPRIIELGLYGPVKYAFQARAAWEMLNIADELGDKIIKEFSLFPNGQGNSGIGLDWYKLNERIWVPADYLNAGAFYESSRAIFDGDETNCFTPIMKPEHSPYFDKVHHIGGGRHEYSTGEEKIQKLSTDPEWRKFARKYAQFMIGNVGEKASQNIEIKEKFKPVIAVLVSTYQMEMK